MSKELVRVYIEERVGEKADRWGHIKYKKGGRVYRYKFQAQTIRHEVRSGAGWVRLSTININTMYRSLVETGKLS